MSTTTTTETTTETAADRQRRLARERQARRRARLHEERGDLATRHCLSCLHPFQPKRADSWLCSRRCIERVSFHRKQAQRILMGRLLSGARRDFLARQHGVELAAVEEAYRRSGRLGELQTAEDIRDWWSSERCQDRTDAVAHYSLWFPDLCGISPEEALVERMDYQRRVAAAWARTEQRLNGAG
jgi:predicted nucleic acid-binding Zn ribbon protein